MTRTRALPGTAEEYYRRLAGLISNDLHTRTVACVGVGAGSYACVKLARFGPRELRLFDFDVVEWPNLCRTAYGMEDIGNLKVEALARQIRQANPFVVARPMPFDVCDLTPAEQVSMLGGADLLIAGTDRFEAQALLNRLSQQLRIPAVFIGIHAGAASGRIIWSVPGQTAC